MTSVLTSVRQVNTGYFMAIATSQNQYVYTKASVVAMDATGTGTPVSLGLTGGAVGDLFKDMGKTITVQLTAGPIVFFRKVQLVSTGDVAKGRGVGGSAATTTDDGYRTGYILLGANGAAGASAGTVAQLVAYGF
jgi:hypothetical protein